MICKSKQPPRRLRCELVVFLILLTASRVGLAGLPVSNRMAAASFDDLMVHIQTYGSTDAKREARQRAREQLIRREERALMYLVDHLEIENMWILIMAEHLVRTLPADAAVPVLLNALQAPHHRTRKFAAYWLGFHAVPAHGPALIPLLDCDETEGAAIRTLGKWRVEAATARIRPYLAHDKERIRILAVNALRDIGDEEAIPDLIAATGDPVFTVRKAASRALAHYGSRARRQILAALETAVDPSRRELISVLGSDSGRGSVRVLRKFLKNDDPLVRDTAARALLDAAPEKAAAWLEKAGLSPSILRVP